MKAKVRQDLQDTGTGVPVIDLCTHRPETLYCGEFDSEQPTILEGEEYNLLLKGNGCLFQAQSIDFEFIE